MGGEGGGKGWRGRKLYSDTLVILCPDERIALDITFCFNISLVVQNANKIWFTA